MLKALGLGRGIIIKIIPNIKRIPRERVTRLTLTKQRNPLVSNNNNPEPQKAASHDQYRTHSDTIKEDARIKTIIIRLNLSPKGEPLVRNNYSAHPEPKKGRS